MSRIRSIHPGQWTDEEFVECSPLARLLALGLRNEADDQGVFEWKPVTLKMRILPADNCDVAALLSELVENRQVIQFEHDGKQYGAIRNFRKYQRPKKPNSTYVLPAQFRKYVGLEAGNSEPDDAVSDNSSPPVPHQFGTGSEISPQMEDGGGRMEEGTSSDDKSSSEKNINARRDENEFERWYAAFPRHVGKGQARKAYWRARLKADADTLLHGIERYRRTKADYADWCHPATWLNGERWNDEPDTEPAQRAERKSGNGFVELIHEELDSRHDDFPDMPQFLDRRA